ncbi:PD-(D/E)XK nuclease family protein [Natrialba swarupiae]|uniref:PD-(D/E)XK nuclease family protein n=1 Tax=Natrialba swarupiae TaxID=2448032 RepID=A0A5D5AQQ5_9EURY|nr:PD-(D/E)XK nuclease family protein [Natrialba swarupiae]TYT63337.1 PD-(D/E)XK nuclease family protein [Natrialba swarupiae]
MSEGGLDGPPQPVERLSVDGVETYLRCPRRYEFAHVHDLESAGENGGADRVDLLRRAICGAFQTGKTTDDALLEASRTTLSEQWADHDERFHSRTQRRHERTVLEATLRAYVEEVGVDHAGGLERCVGGNVTMADVVGPGLTLSRTVSPTAAEESANPGSDGDPHPIEIEAEVDYVFRDGSSLVAARFVPTLAPLGLLRYRSRWEGDVAGQFVDHFDRESDVYDPAAVAALLETAVVLDGLRRLRDRLDLGGKTCRYVQIPLADRSRTSVNWVRESVETSLEIADLTDVYVDQHTYGLTHEHRNETVDGRLAAIVERIGAGEFDPTDRWDHVRRTACPDCGYAVCCQDHIASEVQFDG